MMKQDNQAAVMALRYRLDRYRRMGNGAMCQQLMSEIRRMAKSPSVAC